MKEEWTVWLQTGLGPMPQYSPICSVYGGCVYVTIMLFIFLFSLSPNLLLILVLNAAHQLLFERGVGWMGSVMCAEV